MQETASDALEVLWSEVKGKSLDGFYGPSSGGGAEGGGAGSDGVRWGRLCEAIGRYFERRVLGAKIRRLEASDFDLFASDEALWRQSDGPPPAETALKHGRDVAGVPISRKKLEPFWRWFWQAVTTLRRTAAWSTGLNGPALGFAGFMKKDAALTLLSSAEPGTFLIRFSTSKPGALAVHYVGSKGKRLGTVVSGIVNVSSAGALSVEKRGGELTFHDLDDLVLSTEQLKILHPGVPKEAVFARPRRRESWSADLHAEVTGISRRQSMPPM